MKHILAFTFFSLSILTCAEAQEISFDISELPSMPEPVANNAVTSAYCGDTLCVYSFCGIDSTKNSSRNSFESLEV